ncbi:hypothetical protein VIBHAR_05551 [Vibrio campbellii ATCC BAA-1116]|uniref:Uncharacterized protein n=1 Tax=Vibrio campbellii (strain ATCC BAA-1116) TaxID=2902295 RepID=A7N8C9_VIBC1|nr:hypothetical protein VIBHAR_05551 [Vibrio campbellii ATCC BAA-1116]
MRFAIRFLVALRLAGMTRWGFLMKIRFLRRFLLSENQTASFFRMKNKRAGELLLACYFKSSF